MLDANKKKLFGGLLVLLLLISVPLTLSLLSKPQDKRTRAAGSTTLYFTPSSSTSTPITKNVGDTVSLDLMVDPGTNLVTFVKYQVTFDPTKVQISTTNPMTLNSTVFSSVEGPVTGNGMVAQSVSIGSDPTKAIQKVTKVGTLNFTAIGSTNGTPTTVVFSTTSQALSAAGSDQASQNVLSTTTPATIVIGGGATTVPSQAPTNAPSPTLTPLPTLAPLPTLSGTSITFTIVLHGVGSGGDNPNPTGNSLSNKNPLHPQRNLDVQIIDTNNAIVAVNTVPISYDSASGKFIGQMNIPQTVPAGNYVLKLKSDRYLRKLVPGIVQLKADQQNIAPEAALVAGDTNGDNFLNVIDYNALLDCGYGQVEPLPMTDPNSAYNTQNCKVHTPVENLDVDDNGIVNSYDYNLFLRELSVQNGD